MRLCNYWYAVALVVFFGASSAVYANSTNDPYEKINRKVFSLNEKLDRYIAKPVAKVYKKVTPKPVNRGITNMFNNLGDVPGAVNAVLQGKGKGAVKDTSRFLINSTIGLVGFFDVASKMGIESSNEDFSQTLHKWGVNQGPYIVWPILGGRTARDTVRLGVDTYFNPGSYVDHVATRNTLRGVDLIDTRADLLDAESILSGDRYTAYREAYFQTRLLLINDGKVEDDFGEDSFDDDIFDE